MEVTPVHWCSNRKAKCPRGFPRWHEGTIAELTSFRACRHFPSGLRDLDHRLRGIDRRAVAQVYVDSAPKIGQGIGDVPLPQENS